MQDNDPNGARKPPVKSGWRKAPTDAVERRIVTAHCYDLVNSPNSSTAWTWKIIES
jgi:hypothetical protein